MILAVSPHLDDAVFSVGATLARAAARGDEVVLATVFTRSVASPRGFALACQLDKGLPVEADYMALRRAEDELAARCLGLAGVIHLDLPEAPHRGYGSPAELFAAVRGDDPAVASVRPALADLLARTAPATVLGPQAIGGHVDHAVVADALARLRVPVARWRDVPYVLRARRGGDRDASDKTEHAVAVTEPHLRRKVKASAAYATQVPFQFGGVAAMEGALRHLAHREGARLGVAGPAEVLSLAR